MTLQKVSLLILLVAVSYATDQSESDLRHVLFRHYDHLVRPVEKTTDVIPVVINFQPTGIRDVDVKDREIKLDGWLMMRWEDHHFRWNSSFYGIDHLVLPADRVWRPDISLYTAVSDEHFFPHVRSNVYIWSNGTVLWVPPFTVKSRCPPTQNQITSKTFQCTISFGSWTYDAAMLDVHHYLANPLSRSEGFDNVNPEWKLESMVATSESKKYECCEVPYSLVKYNMSFKKRKD